MAARFRLASCFSRFGGPADPEAAEAHRVIDAGQGRGKLVLVVSS